MDRPISYRAAAKRTDARERQKQADARRSARASGQFVKREKDPRTGLYVIMPEELDTIPG